MRELLAVIREAAGIFNRNGCFTSAAAISFYAFFSLIPMMFLMIAGVGFLLGMRADLQEKVLGLIIQSLPYISERIIGDVLALTQNWKTIGWVGLLTLIWSAEFVMGAASDALVAIFDTGDKFGFFRKKVINLLVILAAVLVALSSVLITAASIILERWEIRIQGLGFASYLSLILLLRFIAPFVLVALVVAAVYRALSGPNLSPRYAFFGAILFTTLWEIAKQLFELYVSNFQSYNRFYGSLGALMVLLLWIFYSANILLFSAAMARAAYLKGMGGPIKLPIHLKGIRRKR